MSEDDDVVGSWSLDDATRLRIRTQRIDAAITEQDWWSAVVEAEELLDQHPGDAPALLRLGEALLELPDSEGAAQAYGQYLKVQRPPEPSALSGMAVARFDLCEMTGCIEVAREAIRLDPDQAAAHYYLGLALERTDGPGPEAQAAFDRAHDLDPVAFPRPIALSDEEWTETVQQATTQLHPTLQAFWAGIPVVLADTPPLEVLRRSDPPVTPSVTALYEGTPPEDDPTQARPTRLALYRANLQRVGTVDAVREEIQRALEGEALHWLGWTYEDLR